MFCCVPRELDSLASCRVLHVAQTQKAIGMCKSVQMPTPQHQLSRRSSRVNQSVEGLHVDSHRVEPSTPGRPVTVTMAVSKALDASTLKTFENAAAGHQGVMSDESGELLVKPCHAAEIAFYQKTLNEHPDFAEMMPTFMGTLSLGAPAYTKDPSAVQDAAQATEVSDSQLNAYGNHIATENAIVLENLEHGFQRPNVLDLKLGSRLHADDTSEEKAARLSKVAAETTSGSLGFRIAGMKVWNGNEVVSYDKLYGRRFNAQTVHEGFSTYFKSLTDKLEPRTAQEILETILAETTKIRHMLEKYESRMYSSSILIVYEGDGDAMNALIGNEPKTPGVDERHPTEREIWKSIEDEEEEDENDPPVAFRVKMIDFAHAEWTPGHGPDDNVIAGLKSIEQQMDQLIASLD